MSVPDSVVGDVFEMKTYCTNDGGQYSINTLHYVLDSITTAGFTVQDLADGFAHTTADLWKAILSDEAEVVAFSARRISVGRKTLEYFNTALGGLGTFAGEVLPGIVCGMVSLRTDLPGPRNRGRLYLPFPSEEANDSPGQPSSAYLTAVDALKVKFAIVLGFDTASGKHTGEFQGCIFHRSDNTITRVTSAVSRSYWARHKTRAGYSRADRPPV